MCGLVCLDMAYGWRGFEGWVFFLAWTGWRGVDSIFGIGSLPFDSVDSQDGCGLGGVAMG